MTKYLLDTQILIWWFEKNPWLPSDIKGILEGSDMKFVSVVSFWEMVIKMKIKKLKLKKGLDFLIKNLEFQVLDIEMDHVLQIEKLPEIHKDPFDRMLVAQAIVEDCKILTTDRTLKKYFFGSRK